MMQEVPREENTALHITKIRGSPEAELEKNCSQHASQCRNSQKTQIPSWLIWNHEIWGKKNAKGTEQQSRFLSPVKRIGSWIQYLETISVSGDKNY